MNCSKNFIEQEKFSLLNLIIKYKQCRRQSKRSEGALSESGETLKLTELLHIKADILRRQIIHYFKNFAFTFEKKRRISQAAFTSSFRMRLT